MFLTLDTVDKIPFLFQLPNKGLVFHITISFVPNFSGTSSMAIKRYASLIFSSNFSRVSPCVIISGCSRILPGQNFSPFQYIKVILLFKAYSPCIRVLTTHNLFQNPRLTFQFVKGVSPQASGPKARIRSSPFFPFPKLSSCAILFS